MIIENGNYLPITIVDRFEDDGPKEERWSGFLTSPNHAMFVEPVYGFLMIVEVKPTDLPLLYLKVGATTELGKISDPSKNVETVQAAVKKLNSMSAYEFVIKIICDLRHDVDFKNMIVPPPLSINHDNTEVAL